MQPVYTLDTLTDAQLAKVYSLTVDISANQDGTSKLVYRVSTMQIDRPPPGLSGAVTPPTITIDTVMGDTIVVHNSIATVSGLQAGGNVGQKYVLSAAQAVNRRLRRRSRRRLELDPEYSGQELWEDEPESQVPASAPADDFLASHAQAVLSKHALKWSDVSVREREFEASQRRSMKQAPPVVRRKDSETSFVFELSQKNMPTTFQDHHHGLREGSTIALPICNDGGKLHDFKLTLEPTPTIPPSLQKQFPHIRIYHGIEVEGSRSADITISTAGIRAQIWGGANQERCYVVSQSRSRIMP